MRIESIKIKNFKAFKNAEIKDIPNFCVIVGANGAGKSTLFEVFGFLKDSMTENVTVAVQKREGFKELISRDSLGNIEFEIKFREDTSSPLYSYFLSISANKENAVIEHEALKYLNSGNNEVYSFDIFKGRN
jgi:predicted ATPase